MPATEHRCRLLRGLAAAIFCLAAWQPAAASAYAFPGQLPAGCSGSGTQYSCATLVLGAGDSVSVTPLQLTTITVDGAMTITGSRINAAGQPGELLLVVHGALTAGPGSVLVADVSAVTLTADAGRVSFGGSITTTGAIALSGLASVAGDVASSSGAISVGARDGLGSDAQATIAGQVTSNGGAITLGAGVRIGGAVTTVSSAIVIGYDAWVSGALGSQTGAIVVGYRSTIGGPVTTTSGSIRVEYGASLGSAVTSTSGSIAVGYGSRIDGAVTSSTGAIDIGYASAVGGAVTSSGSTAPITIGYASVVSACVRASGSATITLGSAATVQGVCCGSGVCTSSCVANNSGQPMPVACSASGTSGTPGTSSGLDHVELRHPSGSALTCSPTAVTVAACSDPACAVPYLGGVTGMLSASASGSAASVNWPAGAGFSIAAGSAATSVPLWITSVGSVALAATVQTPAPATTPANVSRCNFGAPACAISAADSGLLLDIGDHPSGTTPTLRVSARRKVDNAPLCASAFGGTTRSLAFSCAYQNPSGGTLPVLVAGRALNDANSATQACNGAGQAVDLAFDADGVASTTLQYADVGRLRIDARYSGQGADAGLLMAGSSSFIAAPAAFTFSDITAGPIRAGIAFGASITARNSLGGATPNFGRESDAATVAVAFRRTQPAGAAASDGRFSGGFGPFDVGMARASNLVWSEVGRGDLSASLTGANYLGSASSASGATVANDNSGAVGRFVPHHFDVAVTPACGAFSYAGQPFGVTLTAMNGLPNASPTLNYDGTTATAPNFARAVTFSDAPALGVGSFGGSGTLGAGSFIAGVSTSAIAAYTFGAKLTAPQRLSVRAVDADGVSSAGYAEGSTALLSGQLRLSNAFGSEKVPLQVLVRAQVWSGSSWIPNEADNCSVVPAAAVVIAATLDNRGARTTAWRTRAGAVRLLAGSGRMELAPPLPTATGSVELALNLGTTAIDQSCLAAHPPGTGAALPWLRSRQGSCAASWDRDPSARASFGIWVPESSKTMHVREVF